MNEHEAERIAAAMNQLRPDWPRQSILTLIRKNLLDRPRRDVTVALAWVACESGTATPARVLEAGPWWRAAAVEGDTTRREQVPKHLRCSVCSEHKDRCQALWAGDHTFAPSHIPPPPIDVAATVGALRELVIDGKAAKPEPEPPARKRDPRADAARAALHPEAEEAVT